jgi:predicted metalloprotease with PDZ domain
VPTLAFHIDVTRPAQRELLVRATWTTDAGGEVEFFLPTWTPGSYLLREYSRHVSRVQAFEPGTDRELACRKTAKNRWVAATAGGGVELRYRVYAHELTVRTADVDASHAYWNHTCLLLWPREHRNVPAELVVDYPPNWSLSCSLPSHVEPELEHKRCTLHARDLDDALDAPVLIGNTQRVEWQVDGVPHAIELDGLGSVSPPPTLASDLEAITRTATAVFGGQLPYESYLFQALFAGEGYGGLEHRNSSTLLMPRTSLTTDKGYRDFLGLAAHELFHAWNVKRMRPVEFWDYDYEQENYTKLLWVMEGWTAYYDDLLVVRAGLMSHKDYLATMAKNVQGMRSSPGRFELSLEESSFDAWIRLYRPDENTRNSSQNYYGNGAVAALCLDLGIRRATSGEKSLDDVMQQLWRDTYENGRGYELEDVHRAITQVGGEALIEPLRQLVTGPLDPELDEVLVDVGVKVEANDAGKPYLGVALKGGSTKVASVTRGGPAYDAGVAPDDELLAMQNLRVTSGNWQAILAAIAHVDQPFELLVARRGIIRSLEVTPSASPGTIKLAANQDATEPQVAARNAWLGTEAD